MVDAAHKELDRVEQEVFSLYNRLKGEGMCEDCLAVRLATHAFSLALIGFVFNINEDISQEERQERYRDLSTRVATRALDIAASYSAQERL
jgi:hypothetical protein